MRQLLVMQLPKWTPRNTANSGLRSLARILMYWVFVLAKRLLAPVFCGLLRRLSCLSAYRLLSS